ncbi:hypothetical protein V8F06_009053 [Rhypophila decipiens]
MSLSTPETAIGMTEIPTITEPTEDEIQRKPWKYIGYHGYAKFISSDDDFLLLRRFDTMSSRVALSLQDELTVIEEQLGKMDAAYSRRESEDVNNGTMRDDLEERRMLINLAAKRLLKYNEFLLQHAAMKKLPSAPARDAKSIRNWHYNLDNAAIAREEQTYLDKSDLIRLVKQERTPLRKVIDSSLRLRTLPLWKTKKDDEEPTALPNYNVGQVSYYSNQRIDNFASSMIVLIGVAMLIAPIWILQALVTLELKLAIITVFICVFLLLVSFAMVAKPFEALGATAAYAAVLMVFIQFGTDTESSLPSLPLNATQTTG